MPLDPAVLQHTQAMFPMLAACPSAFLKRFRTRTVYGEVSAGSIVCSEGQSCGALAMVLEGSVRVRKTAENGREITLYRIEPGDSCVLTASCIISGATFPARAITERDTRAVMVPASDVRIWLAESGEWREFLFSLVSRRLAQVIATVEEVAFRRMDARVAEYLLQYADDPVDTVRSTHQAIASELGTSREVISRILKDLEHDGLVRLGRGEVVITNAQGLSSRTRSG